MSTSESRELGTRQRGRLIIALVVLSALAVLCAVGIGASLHNWSETHDSLEHWQKRLREETASPAATRPTLGIDSPAGRIRRLETELDAVPERLFVRGFMFLFFAALVALGYRRLRAARRVS